MLGDGLLHDPLLHLRQDDNWAAALRRIGVAQLIHLCELPKVKDLQSNWSRRGLSRHVHNLRLPLAAFAIKQEETVFASYDWLRCGSPMVRLPNITQRIIAVISDITEVLQWAAACLTSRE